MAFVRANSLYDGDIVRIDDGTSKTVSLLLEGSEGDAHVMFDDDTSVTFPPGSFVFVID